MNNQPKHDIFISYCRKDIEAVKAFKQEIEATTLATCWMDLDGIESGNPKFTKIIINAINSCPIFLFMLTEASQQSENALKELDFAYDKYHEEGKKVVIVYIEQCKMNDELKFDYKKADTIDWQNPLQKEKLICDLKKWTGYKDKLAKSDQEKIELSDRINAAEHELLLKDGVREHLPETRILEIASEILKTNEIPDTYKKPFIKDLQQYGLATAQNNLGFFLKDRNKAIAWLKKAAENGSIVALRNIGKCYEEGDGVEKNTDLAICYYKKAIKNGHDDLIDDIKRLSKEKRHEIIIAKTLEGHTDTVYSAAFSPDGTRIVSASRDKTIRIWNAETGECIRTLEGHAGKVHSAAFNTDGTRIVSASLDKTIRIWNAETGECINTLKGHPSNVRSAAFSPDGTRIVSASPDKTIRIWITRSGDCLAILNEHTHWVYYATFSPDGKRIVSASLDKTIRIWDAETKECISILKGHTKTVRSATFSPDGKRIVSASQDETIRIWNTETGECIRTIEGHTNWGLSATFSPDGKRIVSTSLDKTLRIWNAETGKCIRILAGHTNAVYSAAFSPDGKCIVSASADTTLRIWDISDL